MHAGAPLPGLLLWLLPAVFVLHDAEEALFLPGWLRRNRALLERRFQRIPRRLRRHFDGITTQKFAFMAAEELALLIAVTACAALTGDVRPWLALFLAFGLHLLVHLAQWAAAGRYLPAAATALAGLVYVGAGLAWIIASRVFTLREFVWCGLAGCAAAVANLCLLHRLAGAAAGRRRGA